MIEKAIVAVLNANAGVNALVAGRIYPLLTPEASPTDGTYPAVEYQRIDTPREMALSGPVGMAHPRIQFNSYGNTYADCRNVAEAMRKALNGFSGTVGTEDGAVVIQLIELVDERDGYDKDAKVTHVQSDFRVVHLE